MAIVRNLRTQLEAVGRAEERILAGIYGRSVQSRATISDERHEAEPLAERTIQEQRAFERLRASQLNGCAHYVDVHTKDARAIGEDEQRLHLVAVWREAPFFTPRERAALGWTEELTLLLSTGASDESYEAMAQESSRRAGPVAVT